MKIAHINNISGVATEISKYQIQMGHASDVFVFNKIIYRQFGGIKYFYKSPLSRWLLFRKLKDYDLWHYHYPYGSLKKELEKRHSNIIYIKHYHGDDLRKTYDNDFCFVSTPDLLKNAPNAIWIPNPVDISSIENIAKDDQKENKILTIGHYPYYKNYKSEDNYSNTLSIFEKEGKCKIVNIINISHSEALQAIAKCDIIIGKILPSIGWFGKLELESMALRKPVIAYVSEELYEKYLPPLFRTTKNTFEKDLRYLIESKSIRKDLSLKGPLYVKEKHDLKKIGELIDKYYKNFV